MALIVLRAYLAVGVLASGMRRRAPMATLVAGDFSGCVGDPVEAEVQLGASDDDVDPAICDEVKRDDFRCGDAPPISETIDLDDRDDVRYEGDGVIAYVAAVTGETGKQRWETESFESFAERTCESSLVDLLSSHVRAELDDDTGVAAGWGGLREIEGTGVYSSVDVGDHASEDAVEFDELVAVTPTFVRSTVRIADHERKCDVPVFVRETEAPTHWMTNLAAGGSRIHP